MARERRRPASWTPSRRCDARASPITLSRNIESGLEKLRRSHPDLKVVATKNTDFTTRDGLAKTQTLLQSHSDIDVLISAYADITVGAAQALKQSGRAGEVKVFDLGGATSELAFIKDGTITASAAYSPRGHARAALQAILNAFQGEPFDRYACGLSNATPATRSWSTSPTWTRTGPEF